MHLAAYTRYLSRLCVIFIVFVLLLPSSVAAAPLDAAGLLNLHRDNSWYVQEGCSQLSTASVSKGSASNISGDVYMLGDSITVRAKDDLKKTFQEKDAQVYINASVGRSVSRPGQDPATTGMQAVRADKDRIANVDNIVIALGTNGISAGDIDDMMTFLKNNMEDSAKIFWVNIFSTYKGANQKEGNKIIEDSASKGYTVIDTVGKVELDSNEDQPNLHETVGKGTQDFANVVTEGVAGGVSKPNNQESPSLSNGCNCGGSTTLTGNGNQEKVFNFFINNGLTPIQAAGIVGNMMHESGVEPQKSEGIYDRKVSAEEFNSGVGGPGFGIVQWTSDPARPNKFIEPTKAAGKDPNDLGVQLEFVWTQLLGKGPAPEDPRILSQIKEASDIREAVLAFQGNTAAGGPYIGYERPGDQTGTVETRTKHAKDVLEKFGSGGGESSSSSSGSDCSDGGSSGAMVDGYAFPIWAEKQSDYGIEGASGLPCASICHHDGTPALDLSVKYRGSGTYGSEGAPVYAISDGVLTQVNYNNTRPSGAVCNSITFTSSKDEYIYWYGHLKRDTSIPNGKKVKAGEKIGNVGSTQCADNTLPHLHISRVPAGSSADSMGSRDKGLIPIVNKLYENLPK